MTNKKYPPGGNPAFAIGAAITVQGDWGANTLVHEGGHCFDLTNGITAASDWTTALKDDTCVMNAYAKSSDLEVYISPDSIWKLPSADYLRLGPR